MTDKIFVTTTILLLILLLLYYRQYRLKVFQHPGFYFAAIWVFSVPSQWLLMEYNIAFLPASEDVDELNIFVAFTALCFILLSFWGGRRVKLSTGQFSFLYSKKIYTTLVYITFFAALLKFIHAVLYLGASFNMGQTRIAFVEDLNNVYRDLSFFEIIISYTSLFYPIVTILAGYYIGKKLQNKNVLVNSTWLLFLPMVITMLYALSIGGRNPIAIGVKLYLFGFAFALPYQVMKMTKMKIIIAAVVLFIFFGLFATVVGNQRSEAAGIEADQLISEKIEPPLLSMFAGIIEYMSAHYWGYQLRREDTYDDQNFGFGYFTFNGLFELNIPFSSMLGLEGSLGSVFGKPESALKYAELEKAGKPGYFTTYSIYTEMVCDFGVPKTFYFIIFITVYTQWLFLKVSTKNHTKALSIFFFYLNFNYWSSSNFKSSYALDIMVPFLTFLLFDVLQRQLFRSSRSKQHPSY